MPEKPVARSYSAAAKTTKGLSPTDWGDKCFLCGVTIGEGDPIGFYQGRNSFMRCHRGCLSLMETVGGEPKDFHRAKEAEREKKRSAAASVDIEVPPGATIRFEDRAHMEEFESRHGGVAADMTVMIGDQVFRAGETQ